MMQRFSAFGLLLAVVGIGISSRANAISNSSLTVTVIELRNQQGQVCFSLFSDSKGFPSSSDRALQSRCINARETPLAVTFSNLSPGSYAVAVIHDTNGDGTLNRGFLGIPKEGFGFSRNPRIFAGPPSFRGTAVLVEGQSTNIQIQLNYLL